MSRDEILVINSGSSSVRLAAFDAREGVRAWSARVEGVALDEARLSVESSHAAPISEKVEARDHAQALGIALEAAARRSPDFTAIGHRIVHGGGDFTAPVRIDADVEARLSALITLAPLHMPHNLAGVAACAGMWPDAPQVACFDTAFHATLPASARIVALPARLLGAEVRRYGFHGLSYESIVYALAADGADLERERIVIAHLGAGSSMCALAHARSVETTMGFSTLSGLPMGTRSGDVDPGVLLHLMREQELSTAALERVLYEQSGLLAVSGFSGDMRELLKRRAEPRAADAIAFFCYQARRQIGAMAAVLGGLDRLVFTGGIGANAPEVRDEICASLMFLGVELDPERNQAGNTQISRKRGAVVVEARQTDEEGVIAAQVRTLLGRA